MDNCARPAAGSSTGSLGVSLINVECNIYLASITRWVHLQKTVAFVAVPRVGEFIKFKNAGVGDYFGWEVRDVTYREDGNKIELTVKLLDDIDNRGYSFEQEEEFDGYLQSYLDEGWNMPRGVGENRMPGAIAGT